MAKITVVYQEGDWLETLVEDPLKKGHYVCTPF
jgi:hypothetical protein